MAHPFNRLLEVRACPACILWHDAPLLSLPTRTLAGGAGGSCDGIDADDSPASYSNFSWLSDVVSQAHMIAAPGACINSTAIGGGYGTFFGTSAAAPHVAGVLALCYGNGGMPGPCAGKTPAQVGNERIRGICRLQTATTVWSSQLP
jgi:subtilisin family serine protease